MVRAIVTTILLLAAALSVAQGALTVESVISGSAAAEAGLQAGDRFIRLAGMEIATLDDLQQVTEAYQPGDVVPVTVQRGNETVDLTLVFGERPDGGVSIGVRLEITEYAGDGEAPGEPTRGTTECVAWIDETYRIESMMEKLDLDLAGDYEEMLACVKRDTRRMTSDNAIRYCDNVFKVHCLAMDLLTEIGEAQVQWCEERLGESLGMKVGQYKSWKTCGQHKIFDGYAVDGKTSDEKRCLAAFLDECGTNIDDLVGTFEISQEQGEFLECCSADALVPEDLGDAGRCSMLDGGFQRGPCHDRSVCINRLTSEWINCSGIE
jgi:hypothetical protein